LSGFLISSAIIRRHASGTWSWRDYAIDRSSRLYAVLIPGLLFGLLWDKAGSVLFASSGLYSHPLDAFGAAIARNQISLPIFLGNLFFLQTIFCPTFGSNGPLWSLANEFWYYVLFPVALSAGLAWARKAILRAMALTILALCLAVFLRGPILWGFLIWLAGCALMIAWSRFKLARRGWLALYFLISSLLLSACLIAARTGHFAALGSDLAVGVAFGLLLFSVVQMDSASPPGLYARVGHLVAGFSYSLYVLHFPLLLFLRAWITPLNRWQPDTAHLVYGLILGVAVLAFAWVVALFTEKRTYVVRNWMRNAITPPSQGAGWPLRS
jgi:peptidoglycan/LPS O-acetylase OafA/YrhL